VTYDNGVCRSKLLSEPPPSSLSFILPAYEFEQCGRIFVKNARLLIFDNGDVQAADASETRDNAGASESCDSRRLHSYSPSSSYVLNVVLVADEAIEVAAVP
jgi:hypothetical protein